MHLPRYREKRIAEVSGDAIVHKAKAQAVATLSQRISAFQGIAAQIGKREAISKAEEDFSAKVLQGEDFSTIDDNTIYADKYNNLTRNTFIAKTTQGIKNRGVELAAQFKDNPQGFLDGMNDHISAIDAKGADIALMAHATKEAETIRDAMYSKIRAKLISSKSSENAAASKYIMADLEDKMSRAYIDLGNATKETMPSTLKSFNGAVAEYGSFLKSQAGAGLIETSSIPMRLDIAKKSAYKAYIKSGIKTAEASGTQVAFLAKFKTMKHEASNLTLKEIDDLEDEVYDSIRKKNLAHHDVLKRQELDFETAQTEVYKNIKLSMVEHPAQSQNLIKEAYFADKITKARKNELLEEIKNQDNMVSTPDVVNSLIAFPLSYTREEILNHPQLSNKDKRTFLEKINSRPAFTSDINYKQGNKEIMGHFGFVEGTLAGKLDLNNDNAKLYNMLSSRYFDMVNALPVAERGIKSLGIARGLLDKIKSRAKAEDKRREELRQQKFKEAKSHNQETLKEGMKNAK